MKATAEACGGGTRPSRQPGEQLSRRSGFPGVFRPRRPRSAVTVAHPAFFPTGSGLQKTRPTPDSLSPGIITFFAGGAWAGVSCDSPWPCGFGRVATATTPGSPPHPTPAGRARTRGRRGPRAPSAPGCFPRPGASPGPRTTGPAPTGPGGDATRPTPGLVLVQPAPTFPFPKPCSMALP